MASEKKNNFEENLIELFYQLFKVDENEVNEFLKDEDTDLQQLEEENDLFIRKLKGKSEIEFGKKNMSYKYDLLDKAIKKMKEFGTEALSKILTTEEIKQLRFSFRNLNQPLDEKAKDEILQDEQILKIMEKMREDDK